MRAFPEKRDVVDLGCGNFAVGSQIRSLWSKYIACNVVEPLIARNREWFSSLDIDFQELEIPTDTLPLGEVAFLWQVLKHLTNRQIQSTIAKILAILLYLVLTGTCQRRESISQTSISQRGRILRGSTRGDVQAAWCYPCPRSISRRRVPSCFARWRTTWALSRRRSTSSCGAVERKRSRRIRPNQ